MDLFAKITGIKYQPFLCSELQKFVFKDLKKALANNPCFLLDVDRKNQVAISWWVSAKRTRSYPYARVYNTLNFSGKKITVIPVVKDEGKGGDRDFLQWDTVSLMSLLGVYVIIGFYSIAERSSRYEDKITKQRFDAKFVESKIKEILSYQSDALHWNLAEVGNIVAYGQKALKCYERISKKTGVKMHSFDSVEKRIQHLLEEKNNFMRLSRNLAKKAQNREKVTIQPKERISGTKATITIENYLGGYYYFTVDEVEVKKKDIFLIESKHGRGTLPSKDDIRDGLLKMLLFSNLENLTLNEKSYNPKPILKLTVENGFDSNKLNDNQKKVLNLLKKEAKVNKFEIKI